MTAFAQVGRTMRADAVFQGALVAGLVGLTASRLAVAETPAWSHAVNGATDLLMLSLVLVAFLRGLTGLATLERRFWQLLAAGVGSWLLVTLLGLLEPPSAAAWPALALVRSLGYTAIYLWMLVALDLRPEEPSTDRGEERFRWIDGLGLSFTAFGLFVYLSVIPWALGAAVWGTNVPKVVLYLALDGLLLLRLSAPGPRRAPVSWRATYGCLFAVALVWTATDALEVLRWAGWLSEATLATLFDVLWLPPFLGLVLAARVRRQPAAAPTPVAAGDRRPGTPVRGPVLLGQALVLPLFHTVLVGLDAWEPGHHLASWLWALAVPLVLAGLSATYLRGVERLAGERAGRLVEMNRELAATVGALRAARDEATLANEAKTRFLAAMSHEIRTPMNGVLGNVSLLQHTPLSASQGRLVDTIQRSGRTLLAIIDEILDASRLEAGRLRLRSETFDVAATVEEVVESLGPIAREKGLEVGCLVEGPSQPLRGDRDRFRQIVVNLVANAIKYTERGEVAVFAEATGGPEDLVTVAVHVADTGVGIPAEAADLVFEPFGQAASGRPSGGGTGLGLTISRQLALLMGGDIRFESEPGRGSVFHLSVTLGRPTDPEEVRPVPRLSVRRVLVAEPHPLARFVLERHCTQLGIEVRGVADGEGALAALRAAAAGARTFDVALVASGLLAGGQADLLRGLRQASAAGTRVVAVGAPAEGALPTGAVHVLPRPVLRKSLLEALSPSSPVEAEPVVASPASWLSPEARDRRGLVLVVEDNPVNQTVAEGMLGVLGIDAHVAADGAAALACLERTRYDVVLMDCMMPGMDGFEATAELRRRESEQGVAPTPVIALTAIAMPGDRERCLAAGMNDYLAKPFQIETLEAALARVFPRPGAGPAPALGAVGAP